jgi:hypothetical protein
MTGTAFERICRQGGKRRKNTRQYIQTGNTCTYMSSTRSVSRHVDSGSDLGREALAVKICEQINHVPTNTSHAGLHTAKRKNSPRSRSPCAQASVASKYYTKVVSMPSNDANLVPNLPELPAESTL